MLLEPSEYRTAAKQSLSGASRAGRAILIHTGAVLLFSLLLTAADYFLDQQISNTGGLSGMGTRSILVTIQYTLRILQVIILSFWQIGYAYYTLQIAHGQSSDLSDLFQGFRTWGSVVLLKFFQTAMLVILALASIYAGNLLFLLSPWSGSAMLEIETLLTDQSIDNAALIEAVNAILKDYQIPIMIFSGLCFVAGAVFLFFQYRLSDLWLMDHPGSSAIAALRNSRKAMRGNYKAMFRIDLSFWWFYVLEILITVLCYGDVIMDAIGLEMTTDAFTHYLVFFSLYVWAQMALYWWKRNEVSVTYAHAYMALCPKEKEEPAKV